MNSVNFLGQDQFPLSSETMNFIQEMIVLSAKSASIAGEGNYILIGCVQSGLTVSDGIVIIKGEILEFKGGSKQNTVYVNEVRRDVNAAGYQFPQAYKTRTVEFGIGTEQYNWSSFLPVMTNKQIADEFVKVQAAIDALRGIPTGVICMWSGNPGSVPEGWALCDGVGGRPNLLGRFVVGYSQTDTDYDSIGKTGGEKQVILTTAQIPEHKHIIPWGEISSHYNPPWGLASGYDKNNQFGNNESDRDNSWANSSPVGSGKAHENRPPYYVLAYIIKL